MDLFYFVKDFGVAIGFDIVSVEGGSEGDRLGGLCFELGADGFG